MARIRTIKPEFPQSESMGNVSREARLLFILLWSVCDDHGKARGSSRLLASLLYPYDKDVPDLIDGWFDELVREHCVIRYEVEGAQFIKVAKWLDHQKIDRPSASKFPDPSEGSIILAKAREVSSEDQGSRKGPKDHGSEEAEGSARDGSRASAAADENDPGPIPDFLRRPTPAPQAATTARAETDEAFTLWMPVAYELRIPEPGFMNADRRDALAARLRECGGIDGWKLALEKLRDAKFLRDDADPSKPKHWVNLLTLCKPENFTGLMEGRYAERHAKAPKGNASAIYEGAMSLDGKPLKGILDR